jgi:hypothetical protein
MSYSPLLLLLSSQQWKKYILRAPTAVYCQNINFTILFPYISYIGLREIKLIKNHVINNIWTLPQNRLGVSWAQFRPFLLISRRGSGTGVGKIRSSEKSIIVGRTENLSHGNTPPSYSGGLGFKSRSGVRLSWLRFVFVLLSPSRQMPE